MQSRLKWTQQPSLKTTLLLKFAPNVSSETIQACSIWESQWEGWGLSISFALAVGQLQVQDHHQDGLKTAALCLLQLRSTLHISFLAKLGLRNFRWKCRLQRKANSGSEIQYFLPVQCLAKLNPENVLKSDGHRLRVLAVFRCLHRCSWWESPWLVYPQLTNKVCDYSDCSFLKTHTLYI